MDAEWPQNSNDPLRELGSSSCTSVTEVCTLCFPRPAWYQQWSQPVVILSHYSLGHLAISKDIFGCYNGEEDLLASSEQRLQMLMKILQNTVHPSTKTSYPGQNVNGAKFEKLWYKQRQGVEVVYGGFKKIE